MNRMVGDGVFNRIGEIWREYHFLIPPRLWKKYLGAFWKIVTGKVGSRSFYDPLKVGDYRRWIERNEPMASLMGDFAFRPLISVLIPVYNVNVHYLEECINSVLGQSYPNFEICIVDDCSTDEEVVAMLKRYESNEKIKIKYRKKNGHISCATNDALAMATGEFVALVDDDDVLEKNALREVVEVLNKNKKLDFIYSDEDKLDALGCRCAPHFKPDYSPDTLLSMNYICHLAVIRTKLVRDVGGFNKEYDGAQDYDLFLRVLEKTLSIYHIPKILYHWRMTETSTSSALKNKSYVEDKGRMAIEAAIVRRKLFADVTQDDVSKYYRLIYKLKREPLVSILIPMRDLADVTEKCLQSIYEKTIYGNYEVVVVNNNSKEGKTFELFDKYKAKYSNFRVVDVNIEFNYSKLNNLAVREAGGEVLVLLNNDTEVITPEWLNIMVGYAVQSHVGAVGPKLLYPDGTVQHAGVIMGLGGVASHAYIGEKRNYPGAYGRLRVPYNYAAVTGACLCVEKKKYLEVGGLEEDLKVAYNDIDFCLKLRMAGYYNVELPMVELYHYESKSRGSDMVPEKKERFDREQDFMYKKWKDEIEKDGFYNPNFSKRRWFVLDKEKQ